MKILSGFLVLTFASPSLCLATFAPSPAKTFCGEVSASQRTERKLVKPRVNCFQAPCPQAAPYFETIKTKELSVNSDGQKVEFEVLDGANFDELLALDGEQACIEGSFYNGSYLFHGIVDGQE
jgi:hypothetical protein